jgi:hypothetical protein
VPSLQVLELSQELVSNEGKGVEEHEEVEGNLLVRSVGARVARVRLRTVSRSSIEVRVMGSGGLAREGSMGKSGRTSRSRATCLEPRFGRRRSVKWGSTVRLSGDANGRAVVVLGCA